MKERRTSKARRRWVIKAGSNLVVNGGPLLIRSWMQQIARIRRDHNIEVIWVSSGAVATGKERSAFSKSKRTMAEKQALSAIGQPLLMGIYDTALQVTGQLGAQILLTYDDMTHLTRKKNLRNTLNQLLKWNVVPILNENDATATEELQFGDNDTLSAKAAIMMKAERLVILTDVEGLFDSDPRKNPQAQLLSHLPKVTPKTLAMAPKGAGTSVGTGGMHSKLTAAQLAGRHGIETWLAKGDANSILEIIAADKLVGTRIG